MQPPIAGVAPTLRTHHPPATVEELRAVLLESTLVTRPIGASGRSVRLTEGVARPTIEG